MWQNILCSGATTEAVNSDMGLPAFLVYAVGVSLLGVLAPGPVTSATIAAGLKHRHAGALVAIGHGVIEGPLMLLILAGIGVIFKSPAAQVAIGLAGGGFMILIGVGMIRDIHKNLADAAAPGRGGPLMTGIVLTAANPYFLLWWATVGMTLALQARELGALAFVLFAAVHWLCDLFWLEILSFASHRGSKVFGPRSTKVILTVCGLAMLVFAGVFIHNAIKLLVEKPPT